MIKYDRFFIVSKMNFKDSYQVKDTVFISHEILIQKKEKRVKLVPQFHCFYLWIHSHHFSE